MVGSQQPQQFAQDGTIHNQDISKLKLAIAIVCLVWYTFVLIVCALGYTQLWRYYSSKPPAAASASSIPVSRAPHVTIIRPIKGQEPALYACLASTFQQTYPREKLTIHLCISSDQDPAYPIVQCVLADFPGFDARILVETEDERQTARGPNPKISNMSRGYREAKGDIIWIVDCNVWVGKGVAGRMVDKLEGYKLDGSKGLQYKFVHQLPLAIDVSQDAQGPDEFEVASTSTHNHEVKQSSNMGMFDYGGGRLEELFLSSSHAKFYTAINTVLIAPCIVGKSNMFRRSHLDYLTSSDPTRGTGIDYFSVNICEDHLIGDLLWKKNVEEEISGQALGKHALLFGDLAVQPVAKMSVREYFARRVRWLRVRKFTVTLATLVEPGTESFLCSFYGAYALTTLPFFSRLYGIPSSWTSFFLFWVMSVSIWAAVDWTVYILLHSAASIETDKNTPKFLRSSNKGMTRRPFYEWFVTWLGRESLAFPIWAWAVFGGTAVTWRGRTFRVGLDMKVHELTPAPQSSDRSVDVGKTRLD